MDRRFLTRPLNPNCISNYSSFVDQAYYGDNIGHFGYSTKGYVHVNHNHGYVDLRNVPLGYKQPCRQAVRGNIRLGHGFRIPANTNGRIQTKPDLKKQIKNLNQIIIRHLNLMQEQNDEIGEKDREIEIRDKEIDRLCLINKELDDEVQYLRRQLHRKYKRAPSTDLRALPTQPLAKILRQSEPNYTQSSNVRISGNNDSNVVVLQQKDHHLNMRNPMPLPHVQYNIQAETQLLPQMHFHHQQQQQQQQEQLHQLLLQQQQQREQVLVTSSHNTQAVNDTPNDEIKGRLAVSVIDNKEADDLKQSNQSPNDSDITGCFDDGKGEISSNINHLQEEANEGHKALEQTELEIIETHVVEGSGGGEEIYLDALDTAMTEEVVGTVNEEDNSSTGATVIELVETQTVEITEVMTMGCDESHVEYEQIVHTEKIMSEAVAEAEEENSIQETAICIAESVNDNDFTSNAECETDKGEEDRMVLVHDNKEQTAHFYPMVSVPTSVIANSGAIQFDTNSKNLLTSAVHSAPSPIPSHEEQRQIFQETPSLNEVHETEAIVPTIEEPPKLVENNSNNQYGNETVQASAVDRQAEEQLIHNINDVMVDVTMNENTEIHIKEAPYEEVLIEESDVKHVRFEVSEPNPLQLPSSSSLNNPNKRLSTTGMHDIIDDRHEPFTKNVVIDNLKTKPIVTSIQILPAHNMFNSCNNTNTLSGFKDQQPQLLQNIMPITMQQQIMHTQQLPVKKRLQQIETKKKMQQFLQQQTAPSLQQQTAQHLKIHLKNIKQDVDQADKIFPPQPIAPESDPRILVTPTASNAAQTHAKSPVIKIIHQMPQSKTVTITSQSIKSNPLHHLILKNNITASPLPSFFGQTVANIDNAICRITPGQYATRAWEDVEYHCDLEFYLEEANELISDNPMLEIPKWKEIDIPLNYERPHVDTSDDSYNGRHSKCVSDEIRRKKQDEKQISELIKLNRYLEREIPVVHEVPPLETFYPEIYKVEELCFVRKVPVQAFGECLVRENEEIDFFCLPEWDESSVNIQSSKKKVNSSSYKFVKPIRRQRNRIIMERPRGARKRNANNQISSVREVTMAFAGSSSSSGYTNNA